MAVHTHAGQLQVSEAAPHCMGQQLGVAEALAAGARVVATGQGQQAQVCTRKSHPIVLPVDPMALQATRPLVEPHCSRVSHQCLRW